MRRVGCCRARESHVPRAAYSLDWRSAAIVLTDNAELDEVEKAALLNTTATNRRPRSAGLQPGTSCCRIPSISNFHFRMPAVPP